MWTVWKAGAIQECETNAHPLADAGRAGIDHGSSFSLRYLKATDCPTIIWRTS